MFHLENIKSGFRPEVRRRNEEINSNKILPKNLRFLMFEKYSWCPYDSTYTVTAPYDQIIIDIKFIVVKPLGYSIIVYKTLEPKTVMVIPVRSKYLGTEIMCGIYNGYQQFI